MPNIFQLNLTPLINLTSLIEERLGYMHRRDGLQVAMDYYNYILKDRR